MQKKHFVVKFKGPEPELLPLLLNAVPWQGAWVSFPGVSAGDDQKLRLCAKLALHLNEQLLA